MTEKERGEAMAKLFGEGDRRSRMAGVGANIVEQIEAGRSDVNLHGPQIGGVLDQIVQANPTVSVGQNQQPGLLSLLAQTGARNLRDYS